MNESQSFLDFPIFIGGHRRSGTTLLNNLFDNHSEAIVWPDESGFFNNYLPYVKNCKNNIEKIDLCINNIINRMNLAGRDDQLGLSKKKMSMIFYNHVSKTDLSSSEVLKSMILSLHEWLNYPENPKLWIEKTGMSEVYTKEIFEWFPNARFIHVIRNPKDVWSSVLKNWPKEKNIHYSWNHFLQSVIELSRASYKFAIDNQKEYGNKYKIVKYEDIVQKTKLTMEELCVFLGIKFENILLNPTILGINWQGNSSHNVKFKSVSSNHVDNWKSGQISEDDLMVIEYLLSDFMDYFGYEKYYDLKKSFLASKIHYQKLIHYHNKKYMEYEQNKFK